MFYKLEASKLLPSTYKGETKNVALLCSSSGTKMNSHFPSFYFPVAYFTFYPTTARFILTPSYNSCLSQTLELYLLTFAFIFGCLSVKEVRFL